MSSTSRYTPMNNEYDEAVEFIAVAAQRLRTEALIEWNRDLLTESVYYNRLAVADAMDEIVTTCRVEK